MREIKFKAKRLDNGEWVEGDLLHKYWIRGDEFIETAIRYLIGDYYSFPIPVHPKTVCQFTGMYDNTKWEEATQEQKQYAYLLAEKNNTTPIEEWKGVEIWEGDILSVKSRKFTYNVLFELGSFVCYHVSLKDHDGEKLIYGLLSRALDIDFKEFKLQVTGNIHNKK